MTGPTDDREQLLALAGALAADLEKRAAPVVYRVAQTPDEHSAIFRLRYLTVTGLEWASPADMPGGVERDRFDDRAVQIGGWYGAELAACARLVFPVRGRMLPTEEEFDVQAGPTGEVVDLGRGVVAPEYRDPEHRVLLGLFGSCWRVLEARRLYLVCAAAPGWLIDIYRSMGFQVEVLGPPRHHWGEERHPIQIDGLTSVLTLLERLGGSDDAGRESSDGPGP
jgi:N-acyl-L-homoserine lactone synthetase